MRFCTTCQFAHSAPCGAIFAKSAPCGAMFAKSAPCGAMAAFRKAGTP